MAASRFDAIAADLLDEEEILEAEVKSARTALTEWELRLQQVKDARSAMNGVKPKSKPHVASSKSRITKDKVLYLVLGLLSDNDAVPVKDLKGLVEGKLQDEGIDLKGAGMLLKSALRDARIEERQPGVYGLAEPTAAGAVVPCSS